MYAKLLSPRGQRGENKMPSGPLANTQKSTVWNLITTSSKMGVKVQKEFFNVSDMTAEDVEVLRKLIWKN